MISLTIFAPCEKVIIGQDNISSLIGVIEHIIVGGETDDKLPANAGMPFNWTAMALWYRDKEIAEPVSFDAKMDLVSPSGTKTMEANLTFVVNNDNINFRNLFNFALFPIGEAGIYKARLFYKKSSSEDWDLASEYPVRVIYQFEAEKTDENKVAAEIEQPIG